MTQPRPMRAMRLGRKPADGASSMHLLVAALHRAVALTEPDDITVGIGEDLDLDVAGMITSFPRRLADCRRRGRPRSSRFERGDEIPVVHTCACHGHHRRPRP